MNGRTLNWNGAEFEHCTWSYSLPYLWVCRIVSVPKNISLIFLLGATQP